MSSLSTRSGFQRPTITLIADLKEQVNENRQGAPAAEITEERPYSTRGALLFSSQTTLSTNVLKNLVEELDSSEHEVRELCQDTARRLQCIFSHMKEMEQDPYAEKLTIKFWKGALSKEYATDAFRKALPEKFHDSCLCGLQPPSVFSWHNQFSSSKELVLNTLRSAKKLTGKPAMSGVDKAFAAAIASPSGHSAHKAHKPKLRSPGRKVMAKSPVTGVAKTPPR